VPATSTPPLLVKLGIREESDVALIHAPRTFELELPVGAALRRRRGGHADVVLAFFTKSMALDEQFDALAAMIFPDGSLWIAWPKRASGLATDVTDHVVRDAALSRRLVDNKVCAVDDTWTALRLVWRRNARGKATPDGAR
jgi:hypothetical protein